MPETPQMIRQLVRVTGLVQGVGFRPAVYRVALERHLTGFVFNDAAGVGIEIEGEREAVLGLKRYSVLPNPRSPESIRF